MESEKQPGLNADYTDEKESKALIAEKVIELTERLETLAVSEPDITKIELMLQIGHGRLGLDEKDDAWDIGKTAVDLSLKNSAWEQAVEAYDILFQAEQEQRSISALGQGIWLAVTFPVDPELTIGLLEHVIEETPDDYDGAAVAAATACYIADLRTEGKQRDKLTFFTNQLLGVVAQRHANVKNEEQFKAWVQRLELDAPEQFLGRLRQVLEVLVQDDWWYERDELRNQLPLAH